MTNLGTLDWESNIAMAVNNLGQVAGYGASGAVLWDATTRGVTYLGTLGKGPDNSDVGDINNLGQVVGMTRTTSVSNMQRCGTRSGQPHQPRKRRSWLLTSRTS